MSTFIVQHQLRPGLLLIHLFVVQLQLHPGALGGAGEAGARDGLDIAALIPELQRFKVSQRRGRSRRLRGRWGVSSFLCAWVSLLPLP